MLLGAVIELCPSEESLSTISKIRVGTKLTVTLNIWNGTGLPGGLSYKMSLRLFQLLNTPSD